MGLRPGVGPLLVAAVVVAVPVAGVDRPAVSLGLFGLIGVPEAVVKPVRPVIMDALLSFFLFVSRAAFERCCWV